EQTRPFCRPGQGRQVVKIALSFLLLLSVSACASTTDFDLLRQDVTRLERESVETKKEIDSLKEKTSSLGREVSFTAVRESQAETHSRVSDISNSLQELRGRFEE